MVTLHSIPSFLADPLQGGAWHWGGAVGFGRMWVTVRARVGSDAG